MTAIKDNDGSALAADEGEAIARATDDASPVDALHLLIEEARTSVGKEFQLFGAAAAIVASATRRMSIWAVGALLFAFVGLLMLGVGLMLALADRTDMLTAALVTPGLFLLAGGLAWLRARSIGRTLKQDIADIAS